MFIYVLQTLMIVIVKQSRGVEALKHWHNLKHCTKPFSTQLVLV